MLSIEHAQAFSFKVVLLYTVGLALLTKSTALSWNCKVDIATSTVAYPIGPVSTSAQAFVIA